MEAKELRIGNLVSIVVDSHIAEVQSLLYASGSEKYLICFRDISSGFAEESLIGIPLTEEWLLKFGAKRVYGNNFFIGKLKFDINTIRKIRFFWSGKVTYLDYVHQLQNLYFALTGEELTIQETKQ